MSTLPTALGGSATFALYYYDDPAGQTLEATTVCDPAGCNEHVLLPPQTGVAVASMMGVKSFFLRATSTPVPILVRTQSHSTPSDNARVRMLDETRDFIAEINTHALIRFTKSRGR